MFVNSPNTHTLWCSCQQFAIVSRPKRQGTHHHQNLKGSHSQLYHCCKIQNGYTSVCVRPDKLSQLAINQINCLSLLWNKSEPVNHSPRIAYSLKSWQELWKYDCISQVTTCKGTSARQWPGLTRDRCNSRVNLFNPNLENGWLNLHLLFTKNIKS